MTDFKELIIARDEVWENITQAIIDSIPETIAGVIRYITQNNELTQCSVEWRSIANIEDAVELMGTLVYPVGSTFTPPGGGEAITVTDDNAQYFQRALCMYLPLDLVLKEDAAYVFEFLDNMDDDMKQLPTAAPEEVAEPILSEKERIAILMKAKNPLGQFH
jgi:hypothetical protein